ncbi:cytochrome bd-I oxidase subunit CydX [Paracoccus sp. (in: a-proteobacteria)]|nr:cytochrome bd-I oxidase subunit CydX [Paracoccus sp. (in: a-proteobacteria)]
MWYFAWLLGLPLAAAFAVINAMWLELQEDSRLLEQRRAALAKTGPDRG